MHLSPFIDYIFSDFLFRGSIILYFFYILSYTWTIVGSFAVSSFALMSRIKKREEFPSAETKPFVSIIVPARNEQKYIKRCLLSLLSQDYPHFQVIMIDDNSTDETLRIVQSINDTKLKIISIKNTPPGWAGKSWASQVGYLASEGEFLLFTDADCFYHNDLAVAQAVHYMQKNCIDILTGLPMIELKDLCSKLLMPIYNLFSVFSTPLLPPGANLKSTRSQAAYLIGSFFILKKQVIDKIGGFSKVKNSIQEDTDLGIYIRKAGYEISLVRVNDSVVGQWSRDRATLFEGIKRIVSHNLTNNKKNLFVDTFMITFMVILPYVLLPFSLHMTESRGMIIVWNSLLCLLPILGVSILCHMRHRLNPVYALLVLFSSSLLLAVYLVNCINLISPKSGTIVWKDRKYGNVVCAGVNATIVKSRQTS
jgi:chlorobactene glucosyltransferase